MKQKIFTLLSALLFMSSGVWAYEGQVLFSQSFDSEGAGSVAWSASRALAYTTADGHTLAGIVGSGDNLFTSITCESATNFGLGINHKTGGNSRDYTGKFGLYSNSNKSWSLMRTSNFAATAPTAIKVVFNAVIAGVAQTKPIVMFAVGSDFTDGLTSSYPGYDKMYTGFGVFNYYNSSTSHLDPCVFGGNGQGDRINTTSTITNNPSSNKTYTWVINASGNDLTYDDPSGGSTTLATGKWDLWEGTTKIVSARDRTSGKSSFSGTTIQNLYIGGSTVRGEFILDDITVTDLTPNTSDGATFNASGWNTFASSSKLDLSNITGGTAYVAKEVNGSNKVVLTPCTDIVAAGTGIMVKKEGTATKFYIAKTTEEVTSPAADNLLFGVTSATDVPVSTASDYYYVYGWTDPADPGFYKVDGDQPNLPANRAYLHTTKELAARLALDFEEGDVTGIAEISHQQLKANGQYFNLSGQRVSANHKGIVIVNGKKIFNK